MYQNQNIQSNLDCAFVSEATKNKLRQVLVLFFKFPQLFQGVRRPQYNGILIYGPSQADIKVIIKTCFNQIECKIYQYPLFQNINKNYEQFEQSMKQVFKSAQQQKSGIIFIQNIQILNREEESIKQKRNCLIKEMQRIYLLNLSIFIVATTSKPWILNSILLRKFSMRIYISLPDENIRKKLFKNLVKKQYQFSEEEYIYLSQQSGGLSVCNIIDIFTQLWNQIKTPVNQNIKVNIYEQLLVLVQNQQKEVRQIQLKQFENFEIAQNNY